MTSSWPLVLGRIVGLIGVFLINLNLVRFMRTRELRRSCNRFSEVFALLQVFQSSPPRVSEHHKGLAAVRFRADSALRAAVRMLSWTSTEHPLL